VGDVFLTADMPGHRAPQTGGNHQGVCPARRSTESAIIFLDTNTRRSPWVRPTYAGTTHMERRASENQPEPRRGRYRPISALERPWPINRTISSSRLVSSSALGHR
jgi:hypothetical protein